MGLRTIVVAGLAILFIALLYRWATRRYDGWTSNRFPYITLALLLLFGAFEARWVYHQFQMNQALSVIEEEGYTRCQRLFETMFFAGADAGRVERDLETGELEKQSMITYETCRNAISWMESDKESPTLEQASAINILSHEAIHMSGEENEAKTECLAVQWNPIIAQRLGATPKQAEKLVLAYMTGDYPERLPAEYVDEANCRPGGEWDLKPSSNAPWPFDRISEKLIEKG